MTMRKIELFLAFFASIACLGLTTWLAGSIASYQPLWPFPALYLLELVILGVIALYSSLRDSPAAGLVIWAIAGLFLAFVVLGGFSIGLYYFPIVLLFAMVAILSDIRHKKNILPHLGSLFLGVIVQTGLVFLVIQLTRF